VDAVPSGESAGATAYAAVHLAAREAIYFFPPEYSPALWPPAERVQWWVFDVTRDFTAQSLPTAPGSPLLATSPYDLWLLDDLVLVVSDRPPPVSRPLRARFGQAPALEGYDVEPSAEGLRVRLSWRVAARTPADYVRRLEVLAPGGAVLVTQEGPGSRDYWPVSRWRTGQTVVEDVTLAIPPGIPGGALRLRLSWVDPTSGRPQLLPDGSAALEAPA
jgi:hypothetical protein